MGIAEFFYLPYVWPQISNFTKLTVIIVILLPYVFLYLACAADPGYITHENHSYYMSLYPYDYTLYHPGNQCRTCGFLKPARSKHCSICKKCIAKADHHCIFINSCVGYGNHHWFLLLLLSTSVLTLYGGILGTWLLSTDLSARFPGWALWPPKDMTYHRYMAILGWGITRHASFGAVTLLSILTTPLVGGLSVYTFYLVFRGTTTNESLKWSDWKEDMVDGFAFRRPLSVHSRRDTQLEGRCTRWPLEPVQVLVVTQDGQYPRATYLPGEGEWEHIWNIRDVENLYDMKFQDNMLDIVVSDYDFGNDDNGHVQKRRFGTRNRPYSRYPS